MKKLSRFVSRSSVPEIDSQRQEAYGALAGSPERFPVGSLFSREQQATSRPKPVLETGQVANIIWRGTISHRNQEVFSILLTLSGSEELIEGALQAIDPVQGNIVELGLVTGLISSDNVLSLTSNTELQIVASVEDGTATGTITFPESWGTAALVADIFMTNDNRLYNPVVIR